MALEVQIKGKAAFHYRACGLENVFLLNGYTIEETDYGLGFSIQDIDSLHAAIGARICTSVKHLSGKEVRFIRKELDLSQNQLGALLGKSEQTVARWEKGENEISLAADRLLRVFYLETTQREQVAVKLLGLLQTVDEFDENMTFAKEDSWKYSKKTA